MRFDLLTKIIEKLHKGGFADTDITGYHCKFCYEAFDKYAGEDEFHGNHEDDCLWKDLEVLIDES